MVIRPPSERPAHARVIDAAFAELAQVRREHDEPCLSQRRVRIHLEAGKLGMALGRGVDARHIVLAKVGVAVQEKDTGRALTRRKTLGNQQPGGHPQARLGLVRHSTAQIRAAVDLAFKDEIERRALRNLPQRLDQLLAELLLPGVPSVLNMPSGSSSVSLMPSVTAAAHPVS